MTRSITLSAAVALALAVAACGSSSSSSSAGGAGTSSSAAAAAGGYGAPASSSSSSAAAPAGGAASGNIALATDPSGQLKFSTDSLTAKAGTIHIAFTNKSPLGHNLTLVKSSGGAEIAATPTFSGATRTLTVKLAAGTYTYYCSVPGHRMAGMQGTLTVK